MEKYHFRAVALGLCIAAGPAAAQQGGGSGLSEYFTKENIGKAVGAAAGALIGSQIGHGSGKVAAVAIGTLGGYWLGGEVGRQLSANDRAGIAGSTQQALETGQTQTWRNPDSGVYTRVSVADAEPAPPRAVARRVRLDRVPPLDLINAYYRPESNINLRAGPGTDYPVVETLPRGARVPVIGQVSGTDWVMVAEGGAGTGFLYGPLLTRATDQPASGNALREAMDRGAPPPRLAIDRQQCRHISQEVVLPGGKKSVHEFTACRLADGSWTEV